MRNFFLFVFISFFVSLASAQMEQPFEWKYTLDEEKLIVSVKVPEGAYIYAEMTALSVVDSDGNKIAPVTQAVAHEHEDEFGTSMVYEGGHAHEWNYKIDTGLSYDIQISYQGCGTVEGSGAICFPPTKKQFRVGAGSAQMKSDDLPHSGGVSGTKLEALLDKFETVKVDGGVMGVEDFLAFLDLDNKKTSTEGLIEGKSKFAIILLVLLGGLALNLTPCVLPMIPINLAIIGAGVKADNKWQGFIRGGVYGLGIALAYGGFGIFAIFTGAKFGSLNSIPWFNFAIAGVFIILALAMFDFIIIDLSRFSNKFGASTNEGGKLIPTFIMGVVAALLAGACVAPIVIAVLLHSTTLYASGSSFGLFLPFLLGAGMALPWPIAGAGMSVLPKPGKWMQNIKYAFGVVIILFAGYYFYIGYTLLPSSQSEGSVSEQEIAKLQEHLETALKTEAPVFIDFWASWCKNCLEMDASTFKDDKVIKRLHDFTEIKFQAEDPNDPNVKKLMDRYGLVGLPAYVILRQIKN